MNGKPRKEYLAARDPFGIGGALGVALAEQTEAAARVRRREREERNRTPGRFSALLSTTGAANTAIRTVAHGVLEALGLHRHRCGEWRMRRQLNELKDTLAHLKGRRGASRWWDTGRRTATPRRSSCSPGRAGDPGAKEKVGALIRSRVWADWLGDLGRQATVQRIGTAAGDAPVWEAGITEKVIALRARLLGESPTVLDELPQVWWSPS